MQSIKSREKESNTLSNRENDSTTSRSEIEIKAPFLNSKRLDIKKLRFNVEPTDQGLVFDLQLQANLNLKSSSDEEKESESRVTP